MRLAVSRLTPGIMAAVAFSVFINVLMLTVPVYTLQVYDRVLSSKNEMTLLMLTVVAVGLLLAGGGLDAVRNRLFVRIGATFDSEVSPRAFRACMWDRSANGASALAKLVADIDVIRRLLGSPSLGAVFDLPWVPIYLILLFFFHPLLGTVGLVGALLLAALGVLTELIADRPSARARAQGHEANKIVDMVDRNAEAVRAMGLHRNLLNLWLSEHVSALREEVAVGDARGTMAAVAKAFRQALQVSVLGTGAYLAIQGSVSAGVMIAGSIIVARALAPVEGTIGNWRVIVTARSAYCCVRNLLAAFPADWEAMPLPRPSGAVAVDNVMVKFPGRSEPVLYGMSFELEPGDVVGILGRTASGKTTLVRLLVGLLAPTVGCVRLDGTDVTHWSRGDLGVHIGYLPENARLLPGTIAQNIARHGDVEPERVIAAARRANVHELIQSLPEGYDTRLVENDHRLSSGQQQRIALARAVYGNPAFVVLDEPNSNIDYQGDEALRGAVRNLKAAGVTTVLVSHRQSILGCVDKLMVIEAGRIQTFGGREEVIAKLAPRRALTSGNAVDAA